MSKVNKWKFNSSLFGGRNQILEGDETFFISYNPDPSCGFSMFASDGNGPETAVVHRNGKNNGKDHAYFILNGDFRKDYEKLLPQGLKACIEFFESHPDQRSSWSDSPEAT